MEQFFKLPHDMTVGTTLTVKDLWIYLQIKKYDNEEHRCFPSLAKIFNLKAMGQNIINPFKSHEDRIKENKKNLQMLKESTTELLESSNKIQKEHSQLKETQDFLFAEIDKLKELINKKHYE